jgi:hypothetical protein
MICSCAVEITEFGSLRENLWGLCRVWRKAAPEIHVVMHRQLRTFTFGEDLVDLLVLYFFVSSYQFRYLQ